MKKVIFICLLSLSICLSKPDGQPASPANVAQSQPPAVTPSNHTTQVTEQSKPGNEANDSHTEQTIPQGKDPNPHESTQNQNTIKPEGKTDTPKPDNENKTTQKKKETEPTGKEEKKTDPPKAETTTVEVKPTTEKTATSTMVPPNTSQGTQKKNDTVTEKADKAKTTEAPKANVEPSLQARGFDGGSFVGGIILTLGLLAIGFMGYKYYKNQTERNYHTL